jgi:hypothetical protein
MWQQELEHKPNDTTDGLNDWLINRNYWFWHCGFCKLLLRCWTERQEHIAEHFENGMIMSQWNPLKSPYPLMQFSLTPVPGFPPWNPAEILRMQQPKLSDFINR